MHYELEITLNGEYFDVNVGYGIISYLRRFNETGECWYDVKLSKKDIAILKNLAKTEEENDFVDKIRENETVDILEHVRF